MEQGQPRIDLYCYYCSFSSKSKIFIKRHVIKCMENNLLLCEKDDPWDTNVENSFNRKKGYMEQGQPCIDLYCYYCSFSSKGKTLLRRHVIKCMENNLLLCEKDDPWDTNVNSFNRKKGEIGNQHTADLLYCYYCGFKTRCKTIIEQHVIACMNYNLSNCREVKFAIISTDSENILQENDKLGTSEEKPVSYSCKKCDFTTTQESSLKEHMKMHSGEKPFSCSYCDYTASQSGNLNSHLRTHTGEKPFSCSYCDYTAGLSGNLKQHLRIHTGEKPYSCKYCDYITSRSDTLKRHLRTHTGEKPYSCSYCDFTAGSSGQWKEHLRTHTGEKPFSCPYCDYTANRSGSLTQHLRTHTGEKPYSCSYCDYTASHLGNLKQHMRTHTGERPFSCSYCDFTASQLGNLKQHMRTHTGDKPN